MSESKLEERLHELKAQSESDKKRHIRITKVLNLISGFSVAVGASVLAASIFDAETKLSWPVAKAESTLELREEVRRRTNRLNDRLSIVEAALTSVEEPDIAASVAISQANDNSERIEAIEGLLDLQPRQLIQITKLRDEIVDLREDVAAQQSLAIRELDRAYNLMLALVASLLVAVISMIVANFLRRNQE